MVKIPNKKLKYFILVLPVLVFLAVAAWYLHHVNVPVLEPAGEIGRKERNLILFTLGLSAIVVIPVYAMAIGIALKYRESNHGKKRVKYSPDFDKSRLFESLWWGIPFLIIGTLSVVTWNSSHALDPFKPLASKTKPLTIQVICLDWKWLFIYPDQHMASVNEVAMPVNTPVNFHITSDAVMNSFWIPQLGGQIYAMNGMDTQLHLIADRTGDFLGSPANIAGHGYARMDFTAKAMGDAEFNKWLKMAKASPNNLTDDVYKKLAVPSENFPVTYYASEPVGLYNQTILKYMEPNGSHYMVMP
jgi:cytochrome o ubiquinol oxidase subunit 2